MHYSTPRFSTHRTPVEPPPPPEMTTKTIWTLLNVPWGAKLPLVESHLSRRKPKQEVVRGAGDWMSQLSLTWRGFGV